MQLPITGCIVMNSISFDNAYLLLIALPLIAVFTIPFFVAIRKENRNWHNVTSQVLHIVMAIIVAFAAAGTHITQLLTETEVYVVADVSYSANKNLDTIDNYIKNLKLPRNAKVGLVCFGKDSKLVSDLDKLSNIASVKNSGVDDSETNISAALQYAGSLFRDDVIKRIVLITDGKQTSDNNSYSVKSAIDGLETQNVRVDAIYVDDNIKSDAKEVQITKVEYTSSVFLNHYEVANVYIDSNYVTNSIVSLYLKVGMNEYEKVSEAEKVVELEEGQNVVSINLDTSVSGTFDYRIGVEAADDENLFNNTYTFTQDVAKEMKVLVITNDNRGNSSSAGYASGWNNAVALAQRYSDRASLDIYGLTGYSESQLEEITKYKNVTVNQTKNVPSNIEDLSKYDEIILADVDISKLTSNTGTYNTEFANNLDTFVSKFGKSLITFGNTYIHDKDTYYYIAGDIPDPNHDDRVQALSTLGDILPLKYGSISNENKACAIIIDNSRSMTLNGANGLRDAKTTAKRIIDGLTEEDWYSVWTFNSKTTALKPNSVKGNDTVTLNNYKNSIDAIYQEQGGQSIADALYTAYIAIKDTPVKYKEIVLLSDGLEYSSSSRSAVEQAKYMADTDGVVTTTFYTGNGSPTSITNLEDIANAGGGKYYSLEETLSFAGSTGVGSSKKGEDIITGQATVKAYSKIDDVFSGFTGTEQGEIPAINGYFYNTYKSGAITPLIVVQKKEDREVSVPLYAYWNYGNGKVASFASSFAGSWTESWGDSLLDKFFNNVFTQNIPVQKNDHPYNLEINHSGKSAFVRLTPATVKAGTTANIRVVNPNNELINKTMSFNSESFFYEFDTLYIGKYEITVTYNYNGRSYKSTQALTLSYSPEYDAFAIYGAAPLYQALDGRGQVNLDGKLDISKDNDDVTTYSVDLTVMLLIICAILFVLDIIIRKLKWEDIRTFFGFDKKKENKKSEGDK